MPFVEQTQATCLKPLTELECQKVALDQNLIFTSPWTNYPPGCSISDNQNTYFYNKNLASTTECSDDLVCYCESESKKKKF